MRRWGGVGGRGEGWVYSVYSALDYGMGSHLGKERKKPNENTVSMYQVKFDFFGVSWKLLVRMLLC